MTMLTAKTPPITGYEAVVCSERLLTERQTEMVRRLPAGHEFVGVLGRTPIVRGPHGELSRMRTTGRLVRTEGVQAVQSYLLVQG